MAIKLYFPATFFLQYVSGVTDIKDLAKKVDENKLAVLREFVKPNVFEDTRTSVLLPPNLRERFKELRKSLYGLILGKDVILYFSKDNPIEVAWEDVHEMLWEMEELKMDILLLSDLKLRKYSVIDRILVTDLIFRLFYDIYSEIEDQLKEIRKIRELVKNMTFDQSAKYTTIEVSYSPFTMHEGANVTNLYVPQTLKGFLSALFPFMTLSGVIQMALLDFFASGRYTDFKISEPSEIFIQDCEFYFRKSITSYKGLLERFIQEVTAIAEKKDPLEQFILSSLPATFFDLHEKAIIQNYDFNEIMNKVKDLYRRGILAIEGEVIKRRR